MFQGLLRMLREIDRDKKIPVDQRRITASGVGRLVAHVRRRICRNFRFHKSERRILARRERTVTEEIPNRPSSSSSSSSSISGVGDGVASNVKNPSGGRGGGRRRGTGAR